MKVKAIQIAVCVLLATLATGAIAQNIRIFINDERLLFVGASPKLVNGHLMVPMRGVLERLGATVKFDDATKLITAVKDKTEIKVLMGTDVAQINGEDSQMDISARMIGGSAFIPLRFLSEALGADVFYDGQAQAIHISTSADVVADSDAAPNTPKPPAGAFVSNQSGFIGAGIPLKFTLKAPAGGQATFRIPGATGDIQMVEESEGVYAGLYATPAGREIGLILNNAAPIATLKSGDVTTYTQLSNQMSIDTVAPLLGQFLPEPNSRVANDRPIISVQMDDGVGSGVDTKMVQLSLDGKDVSSSCKVTSHRAMFRPSSSLEPGLHEVNVVATDRAGNISTANWSFSILSSSAGIRGFSYTGPSVLEPGSVINVMLVGQEGASAAFSIGHSRLLIPLTETSPGQYSGQYSVDPSDDFAEEVLTAYLRDDSGNVYTAFASDQVSTKEVAPPAPVILTPGPKSPLLTPLFINGTAIPFAAVRVKVTFSVNQKDGSKLTGPIGEVIVQADQNGDFETSPVELDALLSQLGASYTVTAVVESKRGQASLPASITLSPKVSPAKKPVKGG